MSGFPSTIAHRPGPRPAKPKEARNTQSDRRLTLVLTRQLDDEERPTLRSLERVPARHWEWAPHPKSMPLGRLAAHVATLPDFLAQVLTLPGFDIAAPPASWPRAPWPKGPGDLTEACTSSFAAARAALGRMQDDDLWQPFRFEGDGVALLEPGPRLAMAHPLFFGHLAHHRAQIGVYLRLLEIAVPAVYGPSADERDLTPERP